MSLLKRWHELTDQLAVADVKLLAVSKYAPDEAVQLLIEAGQLQFGESRAQNLRDRAMKWPDCEWHMIGPVQKNKAKYIGRHAFMWHSCENLDTAEAVAKHVRKRTIGEKQLAVLIQVNIANIANRHGITPSELPSFALALSKIDGLKLTGLMCMAPQGGDLTQAFRDLHDLRRDVMNEHLTNVDSLALCMGMSGDYKRAIAEGSNMVRLGSTLFGDWDIRKKEDVATKVCDNESSEANKICNSLE